MNTLDRRLSIIDLDVVDQELRRLEHDMRSPLVETDWRARLRFALACVRAGRSELVGTTKKHLVVRDHRQKPGLMFTDILLGESWQPSVQQGVVLFPLDPPQTAVDVDRTMRELGLRPTYLRTWLVSPVFDVRDSVEAMDRRAQFLPRRITRWAREPSPEG
jgi:hypothetical protein